MQQASPEFDIHPATLAKRIKTASIEPGEDGKFSTIQICNAVFGDIDGEKLGKVKAERELLEIELARERGTLIDSEAAFRAWSGVIVSARQVIKSSMLADAEKNEILRNLREIPVDEIIKATADTREDD